jgi:glycosyltransferase involved in cell wall biosynthesis
MRSIRGRPDPVLAGLMKEFKHTFQHRYNIVYLIDGLGMGGAERLMVPILANLNRDVFEPRVCVFKVKSGNPIADELQSNGISVDLLPIPYLRDLTALPRLWKYLKTHRADLVHTQLEFAATLGSFASRLRRLPNVCTIHTMPSQEMSTRWKAHQQVEFLSLKFFCDRVISVSEEARQYHIAISNSAPEKIVTLYNGIDLTPYQNPGGGLERESVRREIGIPANANLFVTVAVLRELKGIQFMIRAMPSILKAFPNAYYLIVGDGAYRGALEEEVKNAGIEKHVIFAGTRKDIHHILSACDIFVLPTLTEALPTVLAEAMASRLPIIASAVGGVPEMVVDGENGILVAAGDTEALVAAGTKLLAEPLLGKRMGEAGWQIVDQKFNITVQVRQLEQLYLDLINAYAKK